MIRFNVPPYTGKEIENVKKAVESMHICGDGEFTKKCNTFLEETTGTKKCLLTTSCTMHWRWQPCSAISRKGTR